MKYVLAVWSTFVTYVSSIRLTLLRGCSAVVGIFAPGFAFAALDPAVSNALTNIQTDGLALQGLVWPVLAVITGGFVMMRIFKRGSSRV